jgi:hypothetical protein
MTNQLAMTHGLGSLLIENKFRHERSFSHACEETVERQKRRRLLCDDDDDDDDVLACLLKKVFSEQNCSADCTIEFIWVAACLFRERAMRSVRG